MKKRRCLFFALSFFLILIFPSCQPKKEPENIKPIDDYLSKSNFTGSVLIAKRGRIVFCAGYGSSDEKNPRAAQNGADTVFEAGSLTKQMVAAAILVLVQKKKLSLDEPIYPYFPEFEQGKKITIRMLLNMRSGLTDHINAGQEFFPRDVLAQIDANQLARKSVDSNIVLDYLPSAPLLAKPDATYFYCNTNYYLLAKILEKTTGLAYADYMTGTILKKCKMRDSNFNFGGTTARAYSGGIYYSIPAELAFGCGDLNSTVMDLYRWNCAFLGGRIISKKYIRQLEKARGYNYGFNCGKGMIFHAGNTNVFNSYSSYNFETKTQIIVLCNAPIGRCNATKVAGELAQIM